MSHARRSAQCDAAIGQPTARITFRTNADQARAGPVWAPLGTRLPLPAWRVSTTSCVGLAPTVTQRTNSLPPPDGLPRQHPRCVACSLVRRHRRPLMPLPSCAPNACGVDGRAAGSTDSALSMTRASAAHET